MGDLELGGGVESWKGKSYESSYDDVYTPEQSISGDLSEPGVRAYPEGHGGVQFDAVDFGPVSDSGNIDDQVLFISIIQVDPDKQMSMLFTEEKMSSEVDALFWTLVAPHPVVTSKMVNVEQRGFVNLSYNPDVQIQFNAHEKGATTYNSIANSLVADHSKAFANIHGPVIVVSPNRAAVESIVERAKSLVPPKKTSVFTKIINHYSDWFLSWGR